MMGEHRGRWATEPQLAIRIILDEQRRRILGDASNFGAKGFTVANPRGILKVRHAVDQLRVVRCKRLLQPRGVDAGIVGWDGVKRWLVQPERLDRGDVSWLFDDHVVAAIEQELAEQIKALLRAVDDHDAIG